MKSSSILRTLTSKLSSIRYVTSYFNKKNQPPVQIEINRNNLNPEIQENVGVIEDN